MRRLLTAALRLMAPLLLLAGCAGQPFLDGAAPGMRETAAVKEQIVVWHTYSDEESRVFDDELIPAFEKDNPDITVKVVRLPNSPQLKSTIISRATSGKTPDIVRMDIAWMPTFSHLGLLYAVSDFADFRDVQQRLEAVTWDTSRIGERYYGLPLDVNAKLAIYNRKLLDELTGGRTPETMETLVGLVRTHKLTLGLSGFTSWQFAPYFSALGGVYLDPSYTRASGYLNGGASVKAVETMVRLSDEGIFGSSYLRGKGDMWRDVMKGGLFMIDDGPWFYSILSNLKVKPDDPVEATIPAPMPGEHSSMIGGENLAIMKQSNHVEASWRLLKWMTGFAFQKRMASTGLLPTNREAIASISSGGPPFIAASLQGLDHPFLRPPIPEWDDVDAIVGKALESIFLEHAPVQPELDKAAAQVDALLAAH